MGGGGGFCDVLCVWTSDARLREGGSPWALIWLLSHSGTPGRPSLVLSLTLIVGAPSYRAPCVLLMAGSGPGLACLRVLSVSSACVYVTRWHKQVLNKSGFPLSSSDDGFLSSVSLSGSWGEGEGMGYGMLVSSGHLRLEKVLEQSSADTDRFQADFPFLWWFLPRDCQVSLSPLLTPSPESGVK